MTDLISRADAIEAVRSRLYQSAMNNDGEARKTFTDIAENRIEVWINEVPSADAECADLPDIPRAYYERIVGNMAHEINMLKEKLESADAEQGEWIRKKKEINDCDGHRAYYWYECSVCGARPPKDTWKNEWHSDFCPTCGARMKGGGE